jgi:hypothetical protein
MKYEMPHLYPKALKSGNLDTKYNGTTEAVLYRWWNMQLWRLTCFAMRLSNSIASSCPPSFLFMASTASTLYAMSGQTVA